MNLWFFESNPEIFRSGTIFVVLLCFESKTGFEMLKLWLSIKVFIKGMIMGAVNVFPVSSGTMSLVLGVFERFVNSIKALNHKNFKSVVYVMKRIEKVNVKNMVLALLGLAISFMLSIKSNPYSNDNFLYLFLCGVVGATGMVVPGVSGSHLMLLMGNYELIVTEAIPALTKASTFMNGVRILLPFLLGAIASIILFSHLLSWLMRDYRNETLSALAGFMLGSLLVVYPWKEPTADMMDYVFHLPNWNSELLLAAVMVVLGAVSVYILELMARHTERKQAERLQQSKNQIHG